MKGSDGADLFTALSRWGKGDERVEQRWWLTFVFAAFAAIPVCSTWAESFDEDTCDLRSSEIYPIRAVSGTPSPGARVRVEILFERKDPSRARRSLVLLTSDATVCRSPHPLLKPEERGWLELGVSPKLQDLKHVKQLVGFNGFSVTVLPAAENRGEH